MGYLNGEELRERAEPLVKSGYGAYLLDLLARGALTQLKRICEVDDEDLADMANAEIAFDTIVSSVLSSPPTSYNPIYQVMFGEDQGPRFGSFAAIYGLSNTRALIAKALAELSHERVLAPVTPAPLPEYTAVLVRGVVDNWRSINEALETYAKGWSLERMPAVDRAILRIAVWELFHGTDVPPVVAVDEAVELAKELSTDESPGFINGVLGQVVLVAPQVRAAASATASSAESAPPTE